MIYLFVIVLILKSCSCVINTVNESEYNRMPDMYSIDDYYSCMREEDGVYCVVDFNLFSTSQSSLMDFIQEYSAQTKKHFNHTQIHRAVCVSSTCKKHLSHELNRTVNLNVTLEACVNETIWDQYGIQAKLEKIQNCNRKDDKEIITKSDIAVVVICAILFSLNFFGTLYDIVSRKRMSKADNVLLLAFSLIRNWNKLTDSGETDERLKRLNVLHGLRTLTMALVILSHTALLMIFSYTQNPHFVEELYNNILMYMLYNGTLVTSTFFIMSSFLLTYNLLDYFEKHEVTWREIPRRIVLRWLRLTPTYGLVLATIATIIRHVGSGPLWDLVVVSESDACLKKWWTNILYVNNYMFSDTNCLPQSWYLAADFQLFVLLVFILVTIRSLQARKIVIILMFIISCLITAALTYYKKLEALFMQTPETYRNLYTDNETFKQIYIPGHTNLSPCAFGFGAALMTYHMQKENKDFSKYKGYRWFYWLLVPAAVGVVLSGSIFYIDDFNPSITVKIIYAMLYKNFFQVIITVLMVGCIFKFESIYRSILEWRGFTWLSRVSYCAFLVHSVFQRCLFGIQIQPFYVSIYETGLLVASSLFTSYVAGTLLYLLVEAPLNTIVKITTSSKNKTESNTKL